VTTATAALSRIRASEPRQIPHSGCRFCISIQEPTPPDAGGPFWTVPC